MLVGRCSRVQDGWKVVEVARRLHRHGGDRKDLIEGT